MQLIVAKPRQSQNYVEKIVERVKGQTDVQNQAIIELVSTVMVYKFPELSREVIEAMFSISELKQTRVYRDAMDEGRVEGRVEGRTEEAQSLILRQLIRRFGSIDEATESQIRSLPLSRLEELGEALLEFSQSSELKSWLETG
jgi:predicted transposase YdaD